LNKRSAHYKKQSKFKGSNREIRGKILKLLIPSDNLTEAEIIRELNINSIKLKEILNQLVKEGFIKQDTNGFSIT
jgi:A/G-specific adenine glycosylase